MGFLLEGLADTDHLAGIMSRHGREKVSEFIRGHKMSNRLNIRVANFGEVIFGRLLEVEGGVHPSYRKNSVTRSIVIGRLT